MQVDIQVFVNEQKTSSVLNTTRIKVETIEIKQKRDWSIIMHPKIFQKRIQTARGKKNYTKKQYTVKTSITTDDYTTIKGTEMKYKHE